MPVFPAVAVTSTGMALPDTVITNADLEKLVDTSDEWIVSRTGIRERRKLESGRTAADLAEQAARQALKGANLDPLELDLILIATVTPDHPTPATSCLLQARLGALKAAAMDISAGCTGFVYALATGRQFIANGACRNVLVIGVEVLSRVTDWEDRGTCVLFGDGAGAVLLQPAAKGRGIMDCSLQADGRGAELLIIPAGGSAAPAGLDTLRERRHYIKMNGSEIFKFAVRVVDDTVQKMLQKHGLSAVDLDYLFLHQANKRIIEHIRRRLDLPPEKVPVNIDRFGNMSSATIPVALHEEHLSGRLQRGDLLLMVAFGSGLTWGGALLEW